MTETKSRVGRTTRTLGAVALVAMLSAGSAGGYAWYKTAEAATSAQSTLNQQLVECEGRAHTWSDKYRQAVGDVALLGARVEVARALMELDDRNFGQVSKYLAAAAEQLDAVSTEAARQVATDLEGLDIRVSSDLEDQRNAIVSIAEQLDSLLNER